MGAWLPRRNRAPTAPRAGDTTATLQSHFLAGMQHHFRVALVALFSRSAYHAAVARR
jgi:hypothetical protein